MSRRMEQGPGSPSFCWVCNAQLQRAPGKGLGLFYFNRVVDTQGVEHRTHGFPCLEKAKAQGCRLIKVTA